MPGSGPDTGGKDRHKTLLFLELTTWPGLRDKRISWRIVGVGTWVEDEETGWSRVVQEGFLGDSA